MTMSTFEEANKTVHRVEDEWHYPIVTAGGFVPETKEGVGFVRSYTYRHPSGVTVTCNTGYSSDYWRSSGGDYGYWGSLESFVNKI
jgi:hypothetical protein